MDCKTTADLATRVVSGNATAQDAVQLRSHLAGCAACADLERKVVRTWELMGQLPAVVSKAPVPAAPRKLVRPIATFAAAAAAILVLSVVAFSLLRSGPKPAPSTPIAQQQPPSEESPRDEESRVQDVLTKIDIEHVAAPAPVVAPPTPSAPEPKPIVGTPVPEPQQPVPATPERKEDVVKTTPAPTRPEEKTPVVKPAPAEVVPVIAVVDRVEGDVFALISGKRTAVQPGHKLVSGDALETSGKTGQAVVEFPDGTRLVLGADTQVDAIRIAEGKRVSLKQGVLAAQISKQ